MFQPINPITTDIKAITSAPIGRNLPMTEASGEVKGASFENMLAKSLGMVNDSLETAGDMSRKLALGEVNNLHEVTLAGQKAKILLNLTTAIASKVSHACTTLFQMQI